MLTCIAGATTTGIPLPIAVVAKVVTGVSSIPDAILQRLFAVAGAISRRSAEPPSPQNVTCSTSPVMEVIAGRPVAYVSASGWMMPQAALLITAWTSAPLLRSACASRTVSTAAILPVTASTILRFFSVR
ncbi:MAG: hypothetical protein A4E42_01836 [Methanoregulaceae archaeon PtaU1.Bin222]|nr:MAG: hypothetical protein A4E42_01836 [Methanoregulaceae archaeon PtaU1.Bin222]